MLRITNLEEQSYRPLVGMEVEVSLGWEYEDEEVAAPPAPSSRWKQVTDSSIPFSGVEYVSQPLEGVSKEVEAEIASILEGRKCTPQLKEHYRRLKRGSSKPPLRKTVSTAQTPGEWMSSCLGPYPRVQKSTKDTIEYLRKFHGIDLRGLENGPDTVTAIHRRMQMHTWEISDPYTKEVKSPTRYWELPLYIERALDDIRFLQDSITGWKLNARWVRREYPHVAAGYQPSTEVEMRVVDEGSQSGSEGFHVHVSQPSQPDPCRKLWKSMVTTLYVHLAEEIEELLPSWRRAGGGAAGWAARNRIKHWFRNMHRQTNRYCAVNHRTSHPTVEFRAGVIEGMECSLKEWTDLCRLIATTAFRYTMTLGEEFLENATTQEVFDLLPGSLGELQGLEYNNYREGVSINSLEVAIRKAFKPLPTGHDDLGSPTRWVPIHS